MGTHTLRIRNLSFETGADVPRHWHPRGRAVTRFFDNLSVFFPVGERFFVSSLQAFRRVVEDDPVLRRQVRDFCAQEGIHGREHERYNAMLQAQGLPIDALEEAVTGILRVARMLPKRTQLGATCALEHFTALMGHFVLRDPRVLEGADPRMLALWRWHAAEENEHKAVAFDVFVKAGGTYPERVVVMLIASAIFWAKVAEHQVRFMAVDGDLWSAEEWAGLVRFLFSDPGALSQVWRLWLEWFRPGFHPDDIEVGDVLAEFDAALAVA
jgi:uncharacterized protein